MLINILKIEAIVIGLLIILYLMASLAYIGMDLEMMSTDYEMEKIMAERLAVIEPGS
jgi:hypothetical protein|tara:strand:- start:572 stop:742 length:171 start_codon:yes stop_codon:yes gene_type:complete